MNLNLSFIKDMLNTPSCFRSKDHIKKFRCYLNCQYASNKFTSEIEQSILYPFSMLELQRLTIVFLQVFIVS